VPAASGERFETRNPATGELLARVARGTAQDVDRAVASARAAFEGPWRRMKAAERQRIMLRLADLVEEHYEELAMLDTLDLGAPVSRTILGKARAGALLRYYAGQATLIAGDTLPNSAPGDVLSQTVKEPMGVVAAINPWNGPIGMSVWKAAPVLASGCTMVMKPAEQTPLSALRFGELCLEAGVPEGVINILTGLGDAGAALSCIPASTRSPSPARPGWGEDPACRRLDHEAGERGTGRQIAQYRLCRCRSRQGGARGRHGGLRQCRADLQRGHAPVRAALDP
jgi:aldehyde dehydrogenase (NAD+)